MKKLYRNLYQTFAFFLFFIIIIFLTSIGILQTSWGRNQLTSYLMKIAQENQIHLQIQETKGIIPSEFIFKSVEFAISDSTIVKIDHLHIQLSLPHLLFKEIAFNFLKADGIHFLSNPIKITNSKKSESIENFSTKKFNYNLFLKSFILQNIQHPDYQNVIFALEGKAKIERKWKGLFLNALLKREGFNNSFLRINSKASKETDLLHTKIKIQSNTNNFFSEFLTLPYDMDFSLKLLAKAKFQDFLNWLYNRNHQFSLSGKALGWISHIDLKKGNTIFEKDWKIFSFFHLTSQGEVNLSDIFCKNKYFTLKGDGSFIKNKIEKFDAEIYSHDLAHFPANNLALSGFLKANLEISLQKNTYTYSLYITGDDLKIQNYPIQNFSSQIQAKNILGSLQGTTNINFSIDHFPFEGSANFSYHDKMIQLKNLFALTPFGKIEGFLDINQHLHLLGSINANFDNLQASKLFFPQVEIEGKAFIAAVFLEAEKDSLLHQICHSTCSFTNFHFHDLICQEATLTADVLDIFSNLKGTFIFTSPQSSLYDCNIESLFFKTSNFYQENPYELTCIGSFKDPFSAFSFGIWSYQNNVFDLYINKLIGKIFSHPFDITAPVHCTFSKQLFFIDDFKILFSEEPLSGKISIKENHADIHLSSQHFPLDFLSINSLQLTTRGFGNLDLHLLYENNQLESNFSLDIEKLTAYPLAGEIPFTINGNIHAYIEKNLLKVRTNLDYKEHEKLFIDADFPIQLHFSPFHLSFDPKLPLKADASFKGRLEEILDFFDTGSHKIEGDIDAHFQARGNFTHPHLEGSASLENGLYENYYSGTYLQKIKGNFVADNSILSIQELSGKDAKEGAFSATGKIHFNPKKGFPFTLKTNFEKLCFVQTDLLTAIAKGQLKLKGSTKNCNATGDITVTAAELTIPEKLPHAIIHLPVKYLPEQENEKRENIESRYIYPINLSVNIFVPNNFKINGQGISSEWKGDLDVKGSYDKMIVNGDLSLLKGEFIFSGHSFDLIHGELAFPGKSGQMPNLHLTGKTSIRGTTILASLQGPVNAPVLDFTSSPALPLSSIISLIIFGQEVSELNALQAIQLVSSMASVSGGGPDIMEKTRKILGIDRLAIVSTPATTIEEPERTALRVGKYIAKGVMVTLSQGMEQDSSNIIVEVDLTHGFTFQAETQREEEQGKFTIKWNLSY